MVTTIPQITGIQSVPLDLSISIAAPCHVAEPQPIRQFVFLIEILIFGKGEVVLFSFAREIN
jgi:hypothetical protein